MNDYIEPISDMMSCYMQTVSEQRASAYSRKLRPYKLEHVKIACARGVENRDTMPSTAYLISVCRELASKEQAQDVAGDVEHQDWITELITQGRRWWDRTSDELGVTHWTKTEADGWRAWSELRYDEGWTPQEIGWVIAGAHPLEWLPTRLKALPY